MSNAVAEAPEAGAVNPETQREVAENLPVAPKKKPSWRARKKQLAAQRAAEAPKPPVAKPSSVQQAAKLQKKAAPKPKAAAKPKNKRSGKDRRKAAGPYPAEVAGLHARKKELQEQLAGIDNAIAVATAALRAAKS